MSLEEFFQYLKPETLAQCFKDVAEVIEFQGIDPDSAMVRDAIMSFAMSDIYWSLEEKRAFIASI